MSEAALGVAMWRARITRVPSVVTKTIVIGEREKEEAEARHRAEIGHYQTVVRDQGTIISQLRERIQSLQAEINTRPNCSVLLGEIPTIGAILAAVSEYFRIPVDLLVGQYRHRKATLPRQVAMYLATRYAMKSTGQIGRVIGGRDHSTVFHGHQKIERLRKSDPALDQQLSDLEARLGRGR